MIKKQIPIFDRTFAILFCIFWILSICILFFSSFGDIVLWINAYSNPFLDKVFSLITVLGHGGTALLLLFLFAMFKSYRSGLNIGITLLFVLLFTSVGKRIIFFQHYRPMWVYYYSDFSRVLYDAPLNYMFSFPSGHTMTAFGIAATIAFFYKKSWLSGILFFLALLIGFSRIYLCQHFFIDIVWGALLGIFSACLSVFVVSKIDDWDKKNLLQMSFLQYLQARRK